MKTLIGILIFVISMPSFANGYEKDIDRFFEGLKKGNIEKIVDELYGSNPYITSVPDQVVHVKNQLKALPALVGELNYLKRLDEYSINNLFTHITYIATYDRQPVRFEFQFFKVKSGWRIYSFSFDAEMDEDLKVFARKRALQASK